MRSIETSPTHGETAQWIERLARFGYAAKGVVYGLVGILAIQAAFNWGGKVTGSEGAFQTIANQPFGTVLLFLVAVGLAGYVVWRLVEAAYDPEHRDNGVEALGRRLSYVASGLIYGSLALTAFRIVFADRSASSGNSSTNEQTASLLAQPFGQWLVGLVGVAAAGYGFYCMYRGIKTKFRKNLKLSQMSFTEEKWATRIGQFGLVLKGVVSVIVGYFFVEAARSANPNQARTTEGALQAIQQLQYGAILMGIVALGLIAYGIHMLVQARYRRISPAP